jgi:DNA-binding MarR family transcriptional regulator
MAVTLSSRILIAKVMVLMLRPMAPAVEIPEVRLRLRRFALHRDRWIDALCRHVGVSRSDYDALEALDEHGSLTPGELGTLLTLTSGSVTALIDRLEKLGWASRNRHPDDRRKVIVTLTQKAWQIGQDELRPYLEAVDTAARQLSDDQRTVVVAFLDDLIDNVARAPWPKEGSEAQSA